MYEQLYNVHISICKYALIYIIHTLKKCIHVLYKKALYNSSSIFDNYKNVFFKAIIIIFKVFTLAQNPHICYTHIHKSTLEIFKFYGRTCVLA